MMILNGNNLLVVFHQAEGKIAGGQPKCKQFPCLRWSNRTERITDFISLLVNATVR